VTEESISPEAAARKTIDAKDAKIAELEGNLAAATGAVRDVNVRDRLATHFESAGIKNPVSVATQAISDFREVPEESFAEQANAWYAEKQALFGGQPAEVPTPTPAETPESPWKAASPNPQAPGNPNTFDPLVAGSPEFNQWAQGKTLQEQQAAVRSGDVVIPQKIREQQRGL
jgi:hypothetical protein